MMTDAEHRVMDLLAEATNVFCQQVVGKGDTRTGDINEWVASIHHLQHQVMSQEAARQHPSKYRLLGETGDDS